MNSDMMTVEEARASARVCRATIYKLINNGHVVSIKIGRKRLIRADSLSRFLECGVADL